MFKPVYNAEGEGSAAPEPKKPPRKPRPSEIAAKKAKAAAKKKAKAKRKPAKKVRKVSKPKSKTKRKIAPAKSSAVRTERLDMRVRKEDRRLLETVAKKQSRTVTAVAWLAIQRGLKGLR